MRPAVTVLIDTYNHERFIAEAIRSVLDQDFPRSQMEILVVDDGSTDRTPEIIRQFEPEVQLLRKPNGGQASAFNFGVARAKGEFVTFLDGDDVWLPQKLSVTLNSFRKDSRIAMVYHKWRFWEPSTGWVWEPKVPDVSGDLAIDRRRLLLYTPSPTSSLAFRREVLERIGPVPTDLTFMADAYLARTAIFLGPLSFIQEPLARNTVHSGNLWFAEKGEASKEALRRRVYVREQAIQGFRRWIDDNVADSALPQARALLRKWRLIQDNDEFRLTSPGRIQTFVHLCRCALVARPIAPRRHTAFLWAKAFAVLIAGEHAHYLEGVRTRARKLKGRLAGEVQAGETAGPVQ